MAAYPYVREAVRKETAERIAAGEFIAGVVDGAIVSSRPPQDDLATRRSRPLDEHAARLAARTPSERKSVA